MLRTAPILVALACGCAQVHERGAPERDGGPDAPDAAEGPMCSLAGSFSMTYELGTFFLTVHDDGTWNLSSSNEGELAFGGYVVTGASVAFTCLGVASRCVDCMGTYDLSVRCDGLHLRNTSISGCPGWPVPQGSYVRTGP